MSTAWTGKPRGTRPIRALSSLGPRARGRKGLVVLAGIDDPRNRMPEQLMGGLNAAELRKLNDLLVRLRGAQD